MAAECDLVLVIGSQNSSNSQRLVEVARDYARASQRNRASSPWTQPALAVAVRLGMLKDAGDRRDHDDAQEDDHCNGHVLVIYVLQERADRHVAAA